MDTAGNNTTLTDIPMEINSFFQPRGIAIIGASATPGSPNNMIVEYAKEMRRDGKIFPVNPKATEIAGLQSFKSLCDIPEPVDLVVMAVGTKNALAVAREISKRRNEKGDAGAVIVVTAGFKEMGTEDGVALQQELIETLKACGARLIGPNCQGIVDTQHGVNTTFSVPPHTPKGGVSIISQSGALATSFLRWARDLKLMGINKFVSLGNMADVNFTELLACLEQDEKTKVISLYIEGMPNAREMFDVAARITRKKPIVAIKGGKSEMGTTVAQSHTASIAGNNDIYDGAFKQSGIIRADTVAEFYHTSRVFDKIRLPKGNRICVLTVVGGPSTICVDELLLGDTVQLAHLSDELKGKLAKLLAPSANIGHPDGFIDMTASVTPVLHTEVLKLLMEDDAIDGILFMTTPPGFLKDEELAEAIIKGFTSVPEEKRKPMLSVLLAGNAVAKCRTILEENGLPTFEFPDDAAKVMRNVVHYSLRIKQN